MKKIETIYHHLLWAALNRRQFRHTQQQLAFDFNYSTSTVYHALIRPTAIGAVRKAGKFFVLQDFNKLLYYWANLRSTAPDVLGQLKINLKPIELETSLPPQAILATYSAASKYLGDAPADYDQISVYAHPNQVETIIARYPQAQMTTPTKHQLQTNLEILSLKQENASQLILDNEITTPILAFVDIWNRPEWYAHDFIQTLQEKFNAVLS